MNEPISKGDNWLRLINPFSTPRIVVFHLGKCFADNHELPFHSGPKQAIRFVI